MCAVESEAAVSLGLLVLSPLFKMSPILFSGPHPVCYFFLNKSNQTSWLLMSLGVTVPFAPNHHCHQN